LRFKIGTRKEMFASGSLSFLRAEAAAECRRNFEGTLAL